MNMDDGYMNDGYMNDGYADDGHVADQDTGARTDDDAVVRVDHLSKKRGKKQVLADLSFEIQRGRVFGLIGPR
jgi:ATPase subunit of ABC transporter with duplicated ATPase domains